MNRRHDGGSTTSPTPSGSHTVLVVVASLCMAAPASAQATWTPLDRSRDNIEVPDHLPAGARLSVTDVDIEQEMARPYAYMSRTNVVGGGGRGVEAG